MCEEAQLIHPFEARLVRDVAGTRIISAGASSYGDYLSIWNDNQLVNSWGAAHDLTSASYQSAFTTNWNAGSYPICVQAGGSGSATRFAAIFAPSETVAGRAFTTTGTAVPELAGFDAYVQNLMQGDDIRADMRIFMRH